MRTAFLLGFTLLSTIAGLGEPRGPFDGLRLEDLSATRDRPLFAPTRRPPPPPVRVEASPPPAPTEQLVVVAGPPPFELIGAAVGTRESIALLRNSASGEILRVRPGDLAEGWRVASVGLRSVALERDGREATLALVGPAAGPAATGAESASEPPATETPAATANFDLRRFAPKASPDP